MIAINNKRKVYRIFGLEIVKYSADYADIELNPNGKKFISYVINREYQITFDESKELNGEKEFEIFHFSNKGVYKSKIYLHEIEDEKISAVICAFIAEYNLNK